MKKILFFSALFAAGIAAFFIFKMRKTSVNSTSPFNLTAPEQYSVRIQNKNYTLFLSRYDPPYEIHKQLIGREQADCSTPEGTLVALWAAKSRDKDWYLSLHDSKAKEKLLEYDKKYNGRILEEGQKHAPRSDEWLRNNYSKLIYKLNVTIDQKEYALIQEMRMDDGKTGDASYFSLVKEDDSWKITLDTNELSPISMLTSRKFEEVKTILTKGTAEFWTDEALK